MYRRAGLVLGLVCTAVVSHAVLRHQGPCVPCGLDAALLGDLLWGAGLIAGLALSLAWAETAPLRKVAVHLAGVATAFSLLWIASNRGAF